MKLVHARQYSLNVPDDELPWLIDAMFVDDPELQTGDYGAIGDQWWNKREVTDYLKRTLIEWLTYQFDMGNYTQFVDLEDGVTFDPDMFAMYLEPKDGS